MVTVLLSYIYSCAALWKHTKHRSQINQSLMSCVDQNLSYPKGLHLSGGAVLTYHHWTNRKTLNYSRDITLEAFAVTGFNYIFLGRKLCQDVKVFQCSRYWLLTDWLTDWLTTYWTSSVPGTDSILKTLEYLHFLMQLCAEENFIISELYTKWRAVKNAEIKLPFFKFLSFFSLWFCISASFNMC
jgi:hypothetical protein